MKTIPTKPRTVKLKPSDGCIVFVQDTDEEDVVNVRLVFPEGTTPNSASALLALMMGALDGAKSRAE